MVKYSINALNATFLALGDPARRAILERLTLGELRVTELAEPFKMSLPAISKHLTVLENAGLVIRKKQGRERLCRLAAGPMKDAASYLSRYRQFWEQQFDALADYLERPKSKKGK